MLLDELVSYVNELLNVTAFDDYAPNGLQVEGRAEVRRLVGGVTASQALIDAALAHQADAVLVHHGYFWKGEDPCITGMKCQRLRTLLGADISLLAYHLPLDAHPELGNNVQLAQRLGISVEGRFGGGRGVELGLHGRLSQPWSADAFQQHVASTVQHQVLHLVGHERPIQRVAWCTGAAQGFFQAAVALGVDAFVSGEVSEPCTHIARETGVHYFAAGHHATERFGVQALGQHLSKGHDLHFEFIDIDNPV
jgi:dinuclear metal center YbgI/SA1388 family protein